MYRFSVPNLLWALNRGSGLTAAPTEKLGSVIPPGTKFFIFSGRTGVLQGDPPYAGRIHKDCFICLQSYKFLRNFLQLPLLPLQLTLKVPTTTRL
jgi:hypothetical protein